MECYGTFGLGLRLWGFEMVLVCLCLSLMELRATSSGGIVFLHLDGAIGESQHTAPVLMETVD